MGGAVNNVNEIRRHIKAVTQTRQITNAMYLLSTSQMKRAISKMTFNRTYLRRIRATVKDILMHVDKSHVFLEDRGNKRQAFVVVAADKEMCGSYNNDILKAAIEKINQSEDPLIMTVGLCAQTGLEQAGYTVSKHWYGASQNPFVHHAREITESLVDLYLENEIDEVYIIFTRYYSQLSQIIRCMRLLPLKLEDFSKIELEFDKPRQIDFTPSFSEVFDTMVPEYMIGYIYAALNHASACENIARMNAMQSATRNADEMINKLNKDYNAARQLAITNEITEIASASLLSENAI
ncbi:MAG: ATP synthase F1 subunit gamma [Ruminococcaceae bacterium]|nr:ATP synthase F1 subunit gamma [Oscillospiraceae bacterium]